MKTLITSHRSLLTILRSRSAFILVALALGTLGLIQRAEALSPPPDGGYPGGNTAEGQAALFNLTSGTFNTAVGLLSLNSLKEGKFNTGLGAGTLLFNAADENTATGAAALLNNTIGNLNTAGGAFSLFSNTEGTSNTAIGDRVLFSNTVGSANSAFGSGALASNTVGFNNTAEGTFALFNNTTGAENTANGVNTLLHNTTGDGNTAIGGDALVTNITGSVNTAMGIDVLRSNVDGNFNTGVGINALFNSTTGNGNTAVGALALQNNTTGTTNTALGLNAGFNITTADSVIVIGNNVGGQNVDHSCFIGEIFGQTSSGGTAVFIDSNGRLGTATSSRRFKEGIEPMKQASEALFALKPVAFRYKKQIDPGGIQQFGLIAEDVEKVNPDLVARDADGKPYTVRYEQVNVMLLNEFLKEHRKNEEQESTIAELKSGMTALAAMVKEQASQIQKVSAQLATTSPSHGGLRTSKFARIRGGGPAPQLVNNP